MRIACFIILFLLALIVPFSWFLIPLGAYLFVWTGYELFIIGIIVDSIFGINQFAYLYTFSVGIGMVCVALIRPYMSWYDTGTTQNL